MADDAENDTADLVKRLRAEVKYHDPVRSEMCFLLSQSADDLERLCGLLAEAHREKDSSLEPGRLWCLVCGYVDEGHVERMIR